MANWLKSFFGGRKGGPEIRRDPLNPRQEAYYPSDAPQRPKGRRDRRVLEAVLDHLERHLGPAYVLEDRRPDTMPIDLIFVPPTDTEPLWTIATAGMSARPMTTPREFHDDRFAELLIRLPPYWPMPDVQTGDASAWEDPAARWPAEYLGYLALYPHTYRTWFGFGQSVGAEDEDDPIAADVRFTACLFLNPVTVAIEGFDRFRGPQGEINLLNVLPLYPEEVEYKRLHGLGSLIDRAGDLLFHVGIIDPMRPSILDPVDPEAEAAPDD